LIVFIWGLAIGCFIIFIDEIIGFLSWKSDSTIYVISPSPLFGLLIIGLFSYFYLRSLLLGALCGIACRVPFFLKSIFIFSSPVLTSISSFLISAVFFALPSILGGYLAERKQS